jgi:hypothetical protein
MLPDWNRPGSFSAGRDPLGLQAASVRLYTGLLPGLTNVTNRLRYFSFYCWVVRQFELKKHSLNEERWRIFIRRAEAVYALACRIGNSSAATGMAGSAWADKHIEIDDDFDFRKWTDCPGEEDQYLKAPRGNFGQFYVASMQQMGFLITTPDRVQIVTPDHGLDLAQAFEAACPSACELVLNAIDSGKISYDECIVISDETHPAKLDLKSDEAALLLRYLRGERTDDETAPARRATLWNVLNIIDRTGIDDPKDLRRELYVQDHIGTVDDASLARNLSGWRSYFVNELCHIALEVVLNELAHRIEAVAGGTADSLSRAIAADALRGKDFRIPLVDVAIGRAMGGLAIEHETGIEMEAIAGSAKRPDKKELRSAVDLLFSLWVRWGCDQDTMRILSDATVAGRSAAGVFRLMDTLSDGNALDGITALIRKFVVGNHLLIAGQKLAGGTYTYRFIVDEIGLVDGQGAEYTFTNPRLGNLLTFAYDGGLLDDDGEIAEAGRTLLDAI